MVYYSRAMALLAFAATSLAATTTVTNVAATTTVQQPTSTATAVSGDISFSAVNKPITVPQIPPHVALSCKNCSTSGTLQLVSGGYNSTDNDVSIAKDFFNHGYLEFEARGVSANVSLDLALQKGFSIANFKVPLYLAKLFTLPLGQFANIDVEFEIDVPISIQLNSEVDVSAGFLLSVPDGSRVFLDVGTPNNSYVTGFNQSTLTPLPFNVNAPDLSFSAITGLEMTLTANASTHAGAANSTIGGDVVLQLDLPLLNTTVTKLSHVNASCDAPAGSEQVFDSAVGVQSYAQVSLGLSGQFTADVAGMDMAWAPPAINAFNRTLPLPSQCYKFDPSATGLVAATATGAPGSSSDSSKKNSAGSLELGVQSKSIMGLLAALTALVAIL